VGNNSVAIGEASDYAPQTAYVQDLLVPFEEASGFLAVRESSVDELHEQVDVFGGEAFNHFVDIGVFGGIDHASDNVSSGLLGRIILAQERRVPQSGSQGLGIVALVQKRLDLGLARGNL